MKKIDTLLRTMRSLVALLLQATTTKGSSHWEDDQRFAADLIRDLEAEILDIVDQNKSLVDSVVGSLIRDEAYRLMLQVPEGLCLQGMSCAEPPCLDYWRFYQSVRRTVRKGSPRAAEEVAELAKALPEVAQDLSTRRFKAVKKFIAENPVSHLRVVA
jgi:hypothetical protein